MRLSIRAEQMSALETETQEKFVRRIAAHLLENYADSEVILPTQEKLVVSALPKKSLRKLVRTGIVRARKYKLTFESSISAFTALMFEISPNFYTNSMCQVILNDEGTEPNSRIDYLLDVLSEKTVKTMKEKYDPEAWKLEEGEENIKPPAENPVPIVNSEVVEDIAFLETVKIT